MTCLASSQKQQHLADAGDLSVIAASGPFSIEDYLDFSPLQALVDLCNQEKPDVLLLLGPFIDAEHPKIKSGSLDQRFQDLFEEQVIG